MALTFTPLENRIANLPKVLAGPILRRTEKNSVSVWIALKEPESNLQLEILDYNAPATGQLMLFGQASTRAFGDYLHVAVITANQAGPGAGQLQHGRIYRYNITFGSGSISLSSPGILSSGTSGIDKIVYGSRPLPSFMLPGSTINNLRILHGSCRKPHGGIKDALQSADDIISSTHGDTATRPQQLMLTGDQIYADDVSDTLMYMLQDAGYTLLGWSETVPLVSLGDLLAGSTDRTNVIMQTAEMSSDASKSHLIKLGEYYAMYLFVWSLELWPSNTIVQEIGDHFNFPAAETHKLLQFKSTLSKVRKALANIPSYMVFDDHEITDDWFLNGHWSRRVLANALGRRIMQNGLSAFAIFQDWGNKPDDYNNQGPGPVYSSAYMLLGELEQLHQNQGANASDWDAIGLRILPVVSGNRLTHNHIWHYSINFDAYQLIGLDTRTRRQFRGIQTGLINSANIPQQLPARTGDRQLSIVLSGAPVIGHTFLEESVQPAYAVISGVEAADFEAWAFHHSIYQELLQHLATYDRVLILSGDVHYGFSCTMKYWDERSGTGSLEHRAKIVQLCSSSLKNSDIKTNFLADNFVPVSPYFLGTFSYVGWTSPGIHILEFDSQRLIRNLVFPYTTLATSTILTTILDPRGFTHRPRRVSGVHRLRIGDIIQTPPNWRYQIEFKQDTRSPSARGIPAPTHSPIFLIGGRFPAHNVQRADSTVIGKDNLGLVTFNWGSSNRQVIQDFYFTHVLSGTPALNPYTKHELSFEISSASDPKPGD